jgi:AI-2 transport protein TqsA
VGTLNDPVRSNLAVQTVAGGSRKPVAGLLSASVTTPNSLPTSAGAALPRGVVILLGAASAVVTIAGLVAFADVIGPVFLGLMLTVAVHPLHGWLRRHGCPGWLAVTLTVLGTFAIVLGLAASLALSIAQLATLLPAYQERFTALLDDAGRFLAERGVGSEQVRAVLARVDFGALAGVIRDLLVGLAGALSGMLFILSVLLFMGLDAAGFPERLRSVSRQRSEIVGAFASFARGTRSYLVVSTVFGAIVAVVDTGVLWAMGIPLALTWGLLAFITNFIPNIGFVIGLVPPALLGLLEGGPVLMIWVIAVYVVINFVIQSVIQPKYVGDAVDLSLTLTFLSLVFWSWVLGPLGAILAIPLTLLSKSLLIDIDPTTRWVSALLTSSRPPEDPGPTPAAG